MLNELKKSVRARLETALKTNNFEASSEVFSELCALEAELKRLRRATHCVSSIIGRRRDPFWQENNPEAFKADEDGTGYNWDNIKEIFPDFGG
jgi:hypothetical protein